MHSLLLFDCPQLIPLGKEDHTNYNEKVKDFPREVFLTRFVLQQANNFGRSRRKYDKRGKRQRFV